MFDKEKLVQNSVERLGREVRNAGYDIDITTLTGIATRVTDQKLPNFAPSDFMPVVVGENPWAEDVLTYKTFNVGDNFESGIIETGSNNGRLATADTHFEGVRVPRKAWGFAINYNIPELMQAQARGNWSLVEKKESARYKSWMLGIQKTAFLGLSVGGIKGLLNQTGVTSNTTVITKAISAMNATEFQAFLAGAMPAYVANANNTAMPDTFIIPSSDYFGLATSADETYPLKSKLERIVESFRALTGNPNFEVKALPYADNTNSGLGVQRYVLYNRSDVESLSFEIPVDYTNTIADTFDGFNYSSVGYGQFSSVEAFRPLEMLYFDY